MANHLEGICLEVNVSRLIMSINNVQFLVTITTLYYINHHQFVEAKEV